MDHASGNLSLLGGLDVLGKLVFPDGYNLNLVTTMIAVQGELEMTASKPVDGTPQIKFTMIGNDDQMTFTPIDANANACEGVSTCTTGKKAIVVAGGKVNSKYQLVPFVGVSTLGRTDPASLTQSLSSSPPPSSRTPFSYSSLDKIV